MTSIRADPPPYVDQYDRPACLPAQLGSPAKGPSDYDYEEDERLPLVCLDLIPYSLRWTLYWCTITFLFLVSCAPAGLLFDG